MSNVDQIRKLFESPISCCDEHANKHIQAQLESYFLDQLEKLNLPVEGCGSEVNLSKVFPDEICVTLTFNIPMANIILKEEKDFSKLIGIKEVIDE